jgi:subtilisin family serine protease
VRLSNGSFRCVPRLLTVLAAASAFAMSATTASAATLSGSTPTRAGEWWLSALGVPRAWQAAPGQGSGITVAVLSTGVDATQPDLAGDVTTGPDFSQSGRGSGGQFWGFEGTAVASLISGHGHGPGGTAGVTGIAPRAKVLSLRVTLEYNDPLNADAAITSRLPDAIADGIRYAVGHGAKVIALPLDPGTLDASTLGAGATGDPAAGGSPAERAAVSYALAHNVVLVAPAGDNGASTGTVNYPAAYPGVVAVGATTRDGQLAPYTATRSYVALTAPGSGLTVAAPGGGYETLSSSDMSSALTAGVATLIRSRYPALTAAEVSQALAHGTVPAPQATPGTGHGALNAASAVAAAASIAATLPVPARGSQAGSQGTTSQPPAAPKTGGSGRSASVAAHQDGAGTIAGSVLRATVLAAIVLIVVAGLALIFVSRRRRARAALRAAPPARRDGPPAKHDAAHAQRGGFRAKRSRGAAATTTTTVISGDVLRTGARHDQRGSIRAVSRARAAADPARPRIIPLAIAGNSAMAGPRQSRRVPDESRPPWEHTGGFAAAPTYDFPTASTGPMYVWNPGATSGPLPKLGPPETPLPPETPRPPDPASQPYPDGQ